MNKPGDGIDLRDTVHDVAPVTDVTVRADSYLHTFKRGSEMPGWVQEKMLLLDAAYDSSKPAGAAYIPQLGVLLWDKYGNRNYTLYVQGNHVTVYPA